MMPIECPASQDRKRDFDGDPRYGGLLSRFIGEKAVGDLSWSPVGRAELEGEGRGCSVGLGERQPGAGHRGGCQEANDKVCCSQMSKGLGH